MIVLKNVTKTFGKRKVLDDVSLQIDPKEFVCITGPSGAGKSTVLALMIGAETVTRGTVEIDGLDLRLVPPEALQVYRRRVGFMFQDYKLLDNRTVEENTAFPLEVCGVPDDIIEKRVPEILKGVDLLDRRRALPQELSGGEKARAALARAIVHHPLILIADEPTGNLDPHESLVILELLKSIHKEGTTVLLATHDATIVDTLQTRVVRLESGHIIRDSVGGYERETRETKTEKVTAPVKHQIFEDEGGGGRKIKITQITSE